MTFKVVVEGEIPMGIAGEEEVGEGDRDQMER